MSTTGQGVIPANGRKFWKALCSTRLRPGCLREVNYTSFGLGDSSYPKFNWAHRKLTARLKQLGCNMIYNRSEADEQHPEGIDASFAPWAKGLKQRLMERYPLPSGRHPIPEDQLLQPKWTLQLVDEDYPDGQVIAERTVNGSSNGYTNGHSHEQDDEASSELYGLPSDELLPIAGRLKATLETNIRITPVQHWQDVRQLTFSTPTPADYAPGDVLTIFPKNFPSDIDALIELMSWSSVADSPIQFVPNSQSLTKNLSGSGSPPVPHLLPYPKLTLRALLSHYLDITSIPRRSFFALVAHFANDETHKERLLEFTNPELIDEYYDYCTRPRRSIIEVLQEFTSVKIPWQWVATAFPTLRGRQFSIASGGDLKRGPQGESRVELLVAIVRYRTVIKKIREGVCTRYLAQLKPGTDVNVLLQRGGLDIKRSEQYRPVVMVGPGTGVAPMRSMIWERLMWRRDLESNGLTTDGYATEPEKVDVTERDVLFFGCRNAQTDYFYQDEWSSPPLSQHLEVYTAFSRDQQQKIYVQDLIRDNADLVYRLLHLHNGLLYISGSSGKMPQAVREALIEVFQNVGQTSREDAEAYLVSMEKNGRYKQETW